MLDYIFACFSQIGQIKSKTRIGLSRAGRFPKNKTVPYILRVGDESRLHHFSLCLLNPSHSNSGTFHLTLLGRGTQMLLVNQNQGAWSPAHLETPVKRVGWSRSGAPICPNQETTRQFVLESLWSWNAGGWGRVEVNCCNCTGKFATVHSWL